MEHPLVSETFAYWLIHYGSFALFGLLALGIIALPVPEETLMIFAGILMSQEYLPLIPTVIAAYAGSITGITVSYLLGRTCGDVIIKKWGTYVGLNDAKMQLLHNWFERFGKWFLVIGYFIPGIRHFTGFFAGFTALSFLQFTLYAYSGAFLWVSTFLSLGYFFGDCCSAVIEFVEGKIEICLLILATCMVIFFILKNYFYKKFN